MSMNAYRKNSFKKVLITGADSYIGTSFEKWANTNYSEMLKIDTVDMRNDEWKSMDFSLYDTIFHVAGIAHTDIGSVSHEREKMYYAVNRDLAVDTAQKAKREGVSQFVFMSSIIIYGAFEKYGKINVITKDTQPAPSNFYGDSKWQADVALRNLQDDGFDVAIIRPPMIYGKGSKGNYAVLEKMAKKLPLFPNIKNERSMLSIEGLTEFLCCLIINGGSGVFFPQDEEYACTSELVRKIAKENKHKIFISSIFNPFVWIASKMHGKIGGLANKAFGSLKYDMDMSKKCFDIVKEKDGICQ